MAEDLSSATSTPPHAYSAGLSQSCLSDDLHRCSQALDSEEAVTLKRLLIAAADHPQPQTLNELVLELWKALET